MGFELHRVVGVQLIKFVWRNSLANNNYIMEDGNNEAFKKMVDSLGEKEIENSLAWLKLNPNRLWEETKKKRIEYAEQALKKLQS